MGKKNLEEIANEIIDIELSMSKGEEQEMSATARIFQLISELTEEELFQVDDLVVQGILNRG